MLDKGYHSKQTPLDLAEMGVRSYAGEPARGRQTWDGQDEAGDAVYADRRRVTGERGRRLLRSRGEGLERAFAHCYETGATRRLSVCSTVRGSVIEVRHTEAIDSFIVGRVEKDVLHIEIVQVGADYQQQGISKQMYKELVAQAGDVREITSELMWTNEHAIETWMAEGFDVASAARWTPAARARDSVRFTEHSYDPGTGMLASRRPGGSG